MRRATTVLIGAALALCVAASAASAASLELLPRTPMPLPHTLRATLRPRTQFSAPRSSHLSHLELNARGFRVGVVGIGDTVAVTVKRGLPRGSEVATAYLARGSVSTRRLAASFGDLGKVDVRFRPSGRVLKSKPRRHCFGPHRYTIRLGVFVGEIRFRGEDGYLSLNAHRAKGRVRYPKRLHCLSGFPPRSGRHQRHRHRTRPALLEAAWHHGVDSTAFFAVKGVFRRADRALYAALTEHVAGRVGVLHEAIRIGSPRGFTLDNALTRASLTPSGPFDGTGLYAAAPDGTKTWGGSLTVSFPGAPHVPLTGPQFKPFLEAGF